MFYSPASLDEAIDALRSGATKSIMVTGPKGSALVTRNNQPARPPFSAYSDPGRPARALYVVGVSGDFSVKSMRRFQIVYDDADAALVFAQRVTINGYAHMSYITGGDRQDGVIGKAVSL